MDEVISAIPERATDEEEFKLSEAIITYGEAMQNGGFQAGFAKAGRSYLRS